MKIVYQTDAKLPRLAWCAEYETGSHTVQVRHGPWVETFDDWFCEGAWDGDFSHAGFADAVTCMGTGAVVAADSVRFLAPSHPYKCLLSVQLGRRIFVSNSLPFVLAATGLRPDFEHTNYYEDLRSCYAKGFAPMPSQIQMEGGIPVRIHQCCSLLLSPNHRERFFRAQPEEPVDFVDYRDRLVTMLGGLRENAADPRRGRMLEPVATLSRGYDSVAIAALGRSAGWRHALTLQSKMEPDYADDGSPVAASLGMSVTTAYRHEWTRKRRLPEAEFYVHSTGGMIRLLAFERELEGRLVLMGELGDRIWDPSFDGVDPNWARPNLYALGGESMWEFSLRIGATVAFPFSYAAVHRDALRRIAGAPEQKAYLLGTDYDRPVPRRIAEEAGVPRELFGTDKMASTHEQAGRFCSRGMYHDFQDFLAENGIELVPYKVAGYRFHWAMDRTMRRYRPEVARRPARGSRRRFRRPATGR